MVHEKAMITHYELRTMNLEDMWLKPHIDQDNGTEFCSINAEEIRHFSIEKL